MSILIARASKEQGPDLISRLCRACALPRSSFYRLQSEIDRIDPDVELRHHLHKVALSWPAYGYRRIAEELQRQGWPINHKRVLRLMRQDNLLCLRKKRFISTTDSEHALRVYPNLARYMNVDGLDQLWVSDITYIRLQGAFVYLAVILDVYSRRCIGWALGRHIDAGLCLNALRMALKQRQPKPGLVHHSDRGVQYCSKEYTELLTQHGITISMSRKGNPYDNAYAESFMKTLKYEEVHLNEYENMAQARSRIANFLEDVYNHKRLHSALGYMPPAEFEQNLSKTADEKSARSLSDRKSVV